MKNKLILSIITVLLSLSAQAQQSPPFLKAIGIYFRLNGYFLQDTTTYIYNPTNLHNYQPGIGRWSFDTSVRYFSASHPALRDRQAFDAQGNIIAIERDSWSQNSLVPINRQTFTYDANGNVDTVTEQDIWMSPPVNKTRYIYTYNTNNQVVEKNI